LEGKIITSCAGDPRKTGQRQKNRKAKETQDQTPASAAFVAVMEDVLAIYHLPYDADYPVVCMDESSKQLIGEVHTQIPGKPGQPLRMDDEYVRKGVAEIFMEVEPLAGKRHVACGLRIELWLSPVSCDGTPHQVTHAA